MQKWFSVLGLGVLAVGLGACEMEYTTGALGGLPGAKMICHVTDVRSGSYVEIKIFDLDGTVVGMKNDTLYPWETTSLEVAVPGGTPINVKRQLICKVHQEEVEACGGPEPPPYCDNVYARVNMVRAASSYSTEETTDGLPDSPGFFYTVKTYMESWGS